LINPPVAGVVLAGGLGRRMGGGDKPLRAIGGRTMLARAIERLAPQVSALAVNANGDPARLAEFRLPVIADPVPGFAGPLAGILAGMRWARDAIPDAAHLVSAAADTPFFPGDLVSRLVAGCRGNPGCIALAASDAGAHPVFGLWPIALADDLDAFLRTGQTGKILAFVDRHRRVDVHFDALFLPGSRRLDPFFNVNTPEDAAEAEAFAAVLDGAAA